MDFASIRMITDDPVPMVSPRGARASGEGAGVD